MPQVPITLLTDFGTDDAYVAQMKGVILQIASGVTIVDLSHGIPPGDIGKGALALDQVVDAFPAETTHIVVVDPGVGSGRVLLGVEAAGQRFVAPDNGVLTLVLERYAPERVHRLSVERFWRHPVASTFHGRDILAPVAAHWHGGADLSEFGPSLDAGQLVRLPGSAQRPEGNALLCEVIAVDRFGNLITNLRSTALPEEARPSTVVSIASETIRGINRFYAERPAGAVMALFGSSGRLEIAVSGGSAAAKLGTGIGETVRVVPGPV